jgi:hypothetical protein
MVTAILVGGCANTIGTASLSGDIRASFTWQDRGQEGTMTATLSTGETFTGPYFYVTQEKRIDTL